MNEEKLKPYVDEYKKVISENNTDERYKLEALKNFQKNWDIEAVDFKGMFDRSLQAESDNLWASMQYYPKKMMIELVELDQESVRSMFRNLFNEDKSLEERINTFIEKSDEFLSYLNKMKPQEKERKQHYHKDVRAIALYLAFKYPDKYYLYKFRETKQFLSQFSNQTLSMGWEPAEKYSFYLRNANELRDILTADKSLIETYDQWLNGKSGANLPPIPDLICRAFRFKPATHSGFKLPLFR